MPVVTSRSDAAVAAPVVLQRTRGEGRVAFYAGLGGTRLLHLYQAGSVKVRLPRRHGSDLEAVLINTAGGLTGGDRLAFSFEVGRNARAAVTNQACERIYRSLGGPAEVDVRIKVEAGGRLDWLPQETILFDRGELRRTLEVDLEPGATLLALEAVIFGRKAMGETVSSGGFHDRWRIRRSGALIFADDLRLEGDLAATLPQAAALAGRGAMASLMLVGDDVERFVEPVRVALGDRGGASAFGGKLLARVTAPDGLSLRRAIIPAIAALRDGALPPRVWQT